MTESLRVLQKKLATSCSEPPADNRTTLKLVFVFLLLAALAAHNVTQNRHPPATDDANDDPLFQLL